ncbi:MAG TPA: SWIM zinc finger family protein [Anaerolineae bacterium]|nr:SWIM zinc finger family protein [Anaerolineae bacterium]
MGWDWYFESKPRKPANGIKAQSKKFGQTWWSGQWLAALERLVDPARLSRGRSYARSGQVLNLDIQAGRIDSRVQGSAPRPYKVKIEIKPLNEKEWQRVADAMSQQAIFAAKLLAGEMPQNIEEAFAAAKVTLFPTSRGDLKTQCSCPDHSNPCKHIAAVYYLLGEQFDSDPFLLFRLRGQTKDEIMSLLRTRRAQSALVEEEATEVKAEPSTPASAEPIEPLEADPDRFWHGSADLIDFHVTIAAPAIDAAPIKRLGAPKFWHGKQDFLALLTGAYQAIAQAALKSE